MALPSIDPRVDALVAAGRKIFRENSGRVLAVILYGSALGPHFRTDSDVDFAILDGARERLSWRDQARYMDLLERALKRGVDLRMLRDGSPSYQMHVLEHGRLVWEREEGTLGQYARKVLPALRATRERALQEWPLVLSRLARH